MRRHSDIFDRQFDFDPSCKLWMPYYKHGLEVGAKFPDYSGNNNHGIITGAAPATYPILSGVDKVINGTFTGDTDWTKGTGWAITTVATATAGVASDLEQNIGATASTRYRLLYTLTRTAGSITPQIGGVNGTARSAGGIYEDVILATGTGNLKFQKDASFAGTVDVVSVQEVVGHEGLGWGFDGVDDKVNCGDTTSLRLINQGTALAWARITQPNTFGVILNKGYLEGNRNHYALYVTSSALRAQVGYDAGAEYATTNISPYLNLWTCVGLTWVTGSKPLLYINNDSSIQGSGNIINDINTSTYSLYAGTSDGVHSFGGFAIGEALIFNRALSAQEIRNYYELTRHIFS